MLAEMLRTNCLQYISGMGPLLFRYVHRAGVGTLGPNVSCYSATAIYRRALRECSAKPPLNYRSCGFVCTADGTLRGQSRKLDEYSLYYWVYARDTMFGAPYFIYQRLSHRDDFVEPADLPQLAVRPGLRVAGDIPRRL